MQNATIGNSPCGLAMYRQIVTCGVDSCSAAGGLAGCPADPENDNAISEVSPQNESTTPSNTSDMTVAAEAEDSKKHNQNDGQEEGDLQPQNSEINESETIDPFIFQTRGSPRDVITDNVYEANLRERIVDTGKFPATRSGQSAYSFIENIGENYSEIHIKPSVIQDLERVTSLAMQRPRAFQYGVLRTNKVTGALLYGPPGTGKSLLARAVAKQSGFNMLDISAADVFQTCWGEDEKVIRAVFSLARKLHPCIVFIDEADAIFGNRKSGDKKFVRSMINQFLMEWDGLAANPRSPFMLLATNRPFDLDAAVLRRAPVHIHIDVPTSTERCGILNLLLKDEILADDVNTLTLAKLTPSYTGSDLKNLCVTAALICVDEQENDTQKRVLRREHFISAMRTIRATGLSKKLRTQYESFEKRAW